MNKRTQPRGSTPRPSPTTSSSGAASGASTRRAARGSSHAPAYSETWTIGDLMDYAREMGFTVQLTSLSEGGRK